MNARERVEAENKKNNASLSHSCYPVNRQCLSRKYQYIKKKKKEKNLKNTNTTQTKLNAPHVKYN